MDKYRLSIDRINEQLKKVEVIQEELGSTNIQAFYDLKESRYFCKRRLKELSTRVQTESHDRKMRLTVERKKLENVRQKMFSEKIKDIIGLDEYIRIWNDVNSEYNEFANKNELD